MLKLYYFLTVIIVASFLVGCGGGSGTSPSTPVTVEPPAPPAPVGMEFDFSQITSQSPAFTADDNRFGVITEDNRNVFRVYDFVDYPNDFRVVEVENFRHNGSGAAQLTPDGNFALLHGTTNTSNVDPDRYSIQFAEGENRNRVSFVGDVETGILYPMDVFEAGKVIVSDSFPIAMNTTTGIAYHYSFNVNANTSEPSTIYTIYGFSIGEQRIIEEIDISAYNCGNNVSPGDYSPERNRVAFSCAGTSIVEILADGTTEQVFPSEPISFINGFQYVGDKVWGTVFGGPVRTSGYTVDLTTGDAEIISPQEFEGEVFGVSEDLRYYHFGSSENVTGDAVGENSGTYVCQTNQGPQGCLLLDENHIYIFKDGRRMIDSDSIVENPIFSE